MLLNIHTVVINLILAGLTGGIIWFIKPKGWMIILLVAMLPLYSLLRPGTYESSDLSIHVSKLIEFYQNFSQAHIPPVWAGNLNAHYGYPLFLFTYQTPYYISATFTTLGLGYVNGLKTAFALAFIVSGLVMYLWAKKEFKSELSGLAAGIFYMFTPYHLVDMHYRAAAGEVMAFMFIPIVLASIKQRKLFTTAVMMWMLILSHQAISLAVLPFVMWYAWRKDIVQLIGVCLGGLMAAHYILPLIIESKYIIESIRPVELVFPKWWELFYSPWRYGLLFQGHYGELSFLVGYTQWLVVGVAFLIKPARPILIAFLIYLFMMQSISRPLWLIIPLLRNFQFAYRLLAVETVLVSVLSAMVIPKLPKRIGRIVLVVTVLYTVLNWGNRRNIPAIGDSQLQSNLPFITYQTEGDVASVIRPDGLPAWEDKIPKDPIEGKIKYQQIFRDEVTHKYVVNAEQQTKVQENTFNFPGWTAYVDRQKVPTTNERGLINFEIPKGKHDVLVVFEQTFIRRIGWMVTFLTLFGLLVYRKARI